MSRYEAYRPLLPPALASSALAAAPNVMGNAFGNPNALITREIFSDFQCLAWKAAR